MQRERSRARQEPSRCPCCWYLIYTHTDLCLFTALVTTKLLLVVNISSNAVGKAESHLIRTWRRTLFLILVPWISLARVRSLLSLAGSLRGGHCDLPSILWLQVVWKESSCILCVVALLCGTDSWK